MVVVAIVCVALLLLYTTRVKERPEFTQVDKPLPLRPSLRYTFTSRAFLVLVSANFMAILMNSLLLGSMFYLSDYVLRTNTLVPLAAVFVPLLIGVPVTQLVTRRLGIVGTQQAFLLLAGIGLILLTFAPAALILPCRSRWPGSAWPAANHHQSPVRAGGRPGRLRSGVPARGLLLGINTLITKPAQSLALALTPFILELGGFVTRESNGGRLLS